MCVAATDDSFCFNLGLEILFYFLQISAKNTTLPTISIFKGDKNLVFMRLAQISCFPEVSKVLMAVRCLMLSRAKKLVPSLVITHSL